MILTKTIKTAKAEILVIGGLPEDAKVLRTVDHVITIESQNDNLDTSDYLIPVGFWQHLGPLSDIPEDVAEKIVGRYFNNYKPQQKLNQQSQYDMFWVKYPDGTNKHFNTKHECYSHALKMELFHIIETNVKLVNKYGANTPKSDMFGSFSRFKEAFEEWQAEEAKVFHNIQLFVEYKS